MEQLRPAAEGREELSRGWVTDQLSRLEAQLATVFASPPTANPNQALNAATWANAEPKAPTAPVKPWLAQTQRLINQPAVFEALSVDDRTALKRQLQVLTKALG